MVTTPTLAKSHSFSNHVLPPSAADIRLQPEVGGKMRENGGRSHPSAELAESVNTVIRQSDIQKVHLFRGISKCI